MKTRILLLILLAMGAGAAARAADAAAATATTPEIDHMVYLSFLPRPDEIMADAKASGLTVLRLEQMAERVVVTYRYPDGRVATLGYARLDATGSGAAMASRPTVYDDDVVVERRTRTIVRDEPEVIYVERPYGTRVVYRDRWDDFWLPLTIGLGVGYISGHHHHYPVYHRGWYGRGWRR